MILIDFFYRGRTWIAWFDFFPSFIKQNIIMKLDMEQSSQNGNRISNEDECEIIKGDAMKEERTRDSSENHDSLQTNLLTLKESD